MILISNLYNEKLHCNDYHRITAYCEFFHHAVFVLILYQLQEGCHLFVFTSNFTLLYLLRAIFPLFTVQTVEYVQSMTQMWDFFCATFGLYNICGFFRSIIYARSLSQVLDLTEEYLRIQFMKKGFQCQLQVCFLQWDHIHLTFNMLLIQVNYESFDTVFFNY